MGKKKKLAALISFLAVGGIVVWATISVCACVNKTQRMKRVAYNEAVRFLKEECTGVDIIAPVERTVIIPKGKDQFAVRIMVEAYDSFGQKFWKPIRVTVKYGGSEWTNLGIEREVR